MGDLTMAVPASWDDYWRLTPEAAAHRGGAPQDELLRRFWSDVFAAARVEGRRRVLDVACGNGAVFESASEAGGDRGSVGFQLCGLDSSPAALHGLALRCPWVHAVGGDAARMPFADRSFDLVTSQFGLEYAGPEAVDEAARILASNGRVVAVAHMKDGGLFRENVANREAMGVVVDSALLPRLKDLYQAHVAMFRGTGSRPAFRRAEAALAEACGEVGRALARLGPAVAGGSVARLQQDVVYMGRRIDSHDPAEVARWAGLCAREAESYLGRMDSMLAASIDESGVERLTKRAESRGLILRSRDRLVMGALAEAAAWALVFE
ncbi:MAG: methyltransferase domain-containing protein [Usitatibacter sp.]